MPAVKNVGEPCAGEPHARFDGGREETNVSRQCRATPGASRLPAHPPLAWDALPDPLVMTVYIPSANRAYRIADHYRARGTHVCLGGLHVTSLPDEAAQHADTIFVGPGEDSWPRFLDDLRNGRPAHHYDP